MTTPSPSRTLRLLEHERVVDAPPGLAAVQAAVQHLLGPQRGAPEPADYHQHHHRHQSGGGEAGLCLLQESGVSRTPYLDRLACFTVGDPPLACPMAVVYKKKGFLSPAARAFIDQTKEFYARFDQGRGA